MPPMCLPVSIFSTVYKVGCVKLPLVKLRRHITAEFVSMGLWSSIIITTILILIAWELRDIKGLLGRVLEHLDEKNDEKEE